MRKENIERIGSQIGFWSLTMAFAGAIGFSAYAQNSTAAKKPSKPVAKSSGAGGMSASDASAMSARFDKELWPVMEKNCAPCHATKNSSQFQMAKDSRSAFFKLIAEGHFDLNNHASIIERVSTSDKVILMPPSGMTPLTGAEKALFNKFAEEVQKRVAANLNGVKPDEVFPAHLESPFAGKARNDSAPNTFLSYRQLRGKIKAIFNDEWKRGDAQSGFERDLFVENVHLFGGADFLKRFDETNKPAATFLTGMDLMGRDVASRAYLERTGPFADFAALDKLPAPGTLKSPDAAYKTAINRMYNRMLFRDASDTEMAQSFAFLKDIYAQQKTIAATAPHDLRFDLTVKDDKGRATTQGIRIAVTPDTHALATEFVDESHDFIDGKEHLASKTLAQPFQFVPGDTDQKIVVSNTGTYGNVSIASVTLRGPLPAKDETVIKTDDNRVRAEGSWNIRGEDGFPSFEDNNENKGSSRVTFPVAVKQAGQYEVIFGWRRFPNPDGDKKPDAAATTAKPRRRRGPTLNAPNICVEVVSSDKASRLAMPTMPAVPPKGQAEFAVDQTVDTLPFWDLRTAFQFSNTGDGIEIKNEGTRKRVVADAIKLMPVISSKNLAEAELLLRGKDAVGRDQWTRFQVGGFTPYNTIGPEIMQDGADGGKKDGLSLFYPAKAAGDGFDTNKFYRVGLIYPGQVDNETRVPVVVKATASTPIVQIAYPNHAHVGANVVVDASSSFNLQRSPLKYVWHQVGGPKVAIKDPTAAKLTFVAPVLSPRQAAWEGLCRALMLHPDFLFTRPRSLATVTDPIVRRRLQLVKIAQDLLARTPTAQEIARVDSGTPLSAFVDGWLKSPEFEDYYYHRVRLYIESHGTPEQDEPARLWAWIARNDHPFKEILTADYTIDDKWQKHNRPAYFGKTGVLTMRGFLEGKPGLPHFNYPAQVAEKFLGYVFEVPDEVLKTRNGLTAAATTDPKSVCYSCHKVLTPLAYQRGFWKDDGKFTRFDETGVHVDDSDQNMVASYPYKGNGLEAFAVQAQNKERFIRTILQTHFVWYFGRELRYETDERTLYKRLWMVAGKNNYAIRPLIRSIILSPEYLNGTSKTPVNNSKQKQRNARLAKLAQYHNRAVVGFSNEASGE